MHDTTTPTTPVPKKKRWPRNVAIGLALTAVLAGGALYYGGRESTLQLVAQKVANASGGKLTLSGVTGSLYGKMHIARAVFRTPEQVLTLDNIDIDWSPRQVLTGGIAIDQLYVASLRSETLKESPPSPMPTSLAAPFNIDVGDARITKAVFVSKGAATEVDNIKFKLQGGKQNWTLRDASAATPFGLVAANASIGVNQPFKLDGAGSLTQSQATAGASAAQIKLKVGGDLNLALLDATAQAGRAVGDGHFAIAPYAPIALRELRLNAKNVDPGFFNPALPTADLSMAIAAKVEDNRNVTGSVNIVNDGPAGALDQQRLPLRTMRGALSGNLNALNIADVLVDFGDAGKFTGSGGVQRKEGDAGLPAADFTLHTDRLDLKQLYSSMKSTRIAGDIRVSNRGDTQTLETSLVDAGMKLTASAALKNNILTLVDARIAAGTSSVTLAGTLDLNQEKPFDIKANASKFNPASFGDFPKADINADIHGSGVLAQMKPNSTTTPAWRVAADFALRPSRLFDQALSGKGKLNADATHISGVDAALALGQNRVTLNGAFGAPGEKLDWRVAASDLSVARGDLYGAVDANGVVTGTMQAPRTTFVLDAKGLGWVPGLRKTTDSVLHASGEGWIGASGPEVKATGTAQRFNPATFGSPLAGSINGSFDASGRAGANWTGALNLALQPSTLGSSPLTGYAKLSADRQHVSNADVDLHVGANLIAAKGNFGQAGDKLDWRIDAPQLAAFGPDFAGMLRGSGTVSGTTQAPSLTAALEGQNIRAAGKVSLKTLKATASLGTGRGAADPIVSDIQLTEFASGDTKIAAARLVTAGTRGAHTLKLTARADKFDTNAEVRGGWKGDAWTGTIAALQNRGQYAVTLQAPVPLTLTTAPGAGVAGLASPQRIDLGNAVLALANGTVNIASLTKNGGHWASRGAATAVPLTYLAKLAPAVGENLAGSLTLGAQWGLDLQMVAGGVPALNGNVRVFREAGDLVVGTDTPVVLGLSKLEARADVTSGSLRMQLDVAGSRLGSARVDATAQMIKGLLGNDSPLRFTADADMGSIAWMAPLVGQPGLELDGALKLALTGAGTVGTPTLNGNVNGDNMTVRWADQGLRLRNGQLRAQLTGDQLLLQRLAFDGASGNALATGTVRFASGEATANLKLVANKLEVLSRPDRTLIVSGESTLVRDARVFELDGKFKADRALLELAPLGRPTISSDVVVLGRSNVAPQKAEASKPLSVDIAIDMGDDFHLRGMGADAYLAGSARLRMSGGRPPRVNGSIRVNNGTYAAYGQKLTIERGVLTFSGPYDNPSLNILAVRKRPEGEQLTDTNVEAGVEVRGTALAPSAKLVSTPTVPDSEKLSWLVLGHGMEGTAGNEAGVLSAAAGALLGGAGGTGGFQSKIANSLGLDELGVSQAAGLETTVVTVGKRISNRLYVTFEQGAATASSLVKVRYKINPRLSVQVQTGTNIALDLLYSWAFD
ncbi:translocation/assembly module TamB domain-containing protein [Massilia sp. S19_KUP03_FR1]|uniref:translocation/assembly module TamB domain-containing protein n=1 Tax=Massilia sp. S19_KUP03_FR1 TaxID=3025503 RepID=UPI002FCDDD11